MIRLDCIVCYDRSNAIESSSVNFRYSLWVNFLLATERWLLTIGFIFSDGLSFGRSVYFCCYLNDTCDPNDCEDFMSCLLSDRGRQETVYAAAVAVWPELLHFTANWTEPIAFFRYTCTLHCIHSVCLLHSVSLSALCPTLSPSLFAALSFSTTSCGRLSGAPIVRL